MERIEHQLGAQGVREAARLYEDAYRGSGLGEQEIEDQMLSDFASGINIFRGEGTQNLTGQASGDEAPGSLSGPPDGSSPSGPPSDPLADDSGQPERVFPKEPREEPESGKETR